MRHRVLFLSARRRDTASRLLSCSYAFRQRRTARRMEYYLLSGVSARLVMITGQDAPQMVLAMVLPAM